MQSRRQSGLEAVANTLLGFVGSYLITYLILLNVGGSIAAHALWTCLACTVWSLVRGYGLRRLFNRLHRPRD